MNKEIQDELKLVYVVEAKPEKIDTLLKRLEGIMFLELGIFLILMYMFLNQSLKYIKD